MGWSVSKSCTCIPSLCLSSQRHSCWNEMFTPQSFHFQITNTTTANDACWYAMQVKKLNVDGNWAIFEQVKGGKLGKCSTS